MGRLILPYGKSAVLPSALAIMGLTNSSTLRTNERTYVDVGYVGIESYVSYRARGFEGIFAARKSVES